MNLLLLAVESAHSHEIGLSYGYVENNEIRLVWAVEELEPLGLAELTDGGARLHEFARDRLDLTVDGQICEFDGAFTIALVEGDGVELSIAHACSGENWSYNPGFFSDLSEGHRHYVEHNAMAVAVLDAGDPVAEFADEAATGAVAWEFVELGVEHIWTGYDHLAFLFALLLVARSLKEMLAIVTGFTLAHSVTLSVAALGWVVLPGSIVEPTIALTIAYAGIENFFDPSARRRFAVTCALGLIHGFGFAGMLAERGLPQGNLVTALVGFNGGVELGQAAVVAVVLPVLLKLRKNEAWLKWGVKGGSALIAVMGVYWFIERTLL